MLAKNQEVEGLPFHPTINPLSWEMGDHSLRVDKNDGMGSIHDVLYLNSQYRKKEHEVLVKEYETRTSCTFYP